MKAMLTYRQKSTFGFYPKTQHSSRRALLRANVLCLFFPIIIALTALSGCIQNQPSEPLTKGKGPLKLSHPQPYSNVLESSYYAADSLGEGLRFREFSPDVPILVASFVNIDDLNQSSTLGRMVSEQIASRLAQQGFKIIETKLRQGSIFVQKGKGEFLLSRELLNLSVNQGAQGVLVGTYAVSKHFIFISARIVRTEDSSVITGYDYEIPQNKTTRSML
jgi:TolB-like protein